MRTVLGSSRISTRARCRGIETEVTNSRACLGQLYFHVPGGTKYGQYWLNVKFAQSVVRVPFRLFTKDEEKKLGKNYGDIKKQVDAAFRKKPAK